MIYEIPFTPGDVFVDQETNLEGTVYLLQFLYNQRENCYYLNVGDATVTDGTWLIAGIKLQTNYPLLRRWAGAAAASAQTQGHANVWPPGELVAYSTTPDDSIAGLGDLGARVQLLYITSSDAILGGPGP